MFFNFMAAVTIFSDFGAQENSLSRLPLFLHLFAISDGTGCHDLSFLNFEFFECRGIHCKGAKRNFPGILKGSRSGLGRRL